MNPKRLLALSILLSCYVTGCTEDSKKDDNKVQTDLCSNITTPSCDANNGWLKSCVNGTIDRTQCNNETQTCDPTRGCIEKQPGNIVNPPDKCANVTAPSCDHNTWIKSCKDGVIDSVECNAKTHTCDPVKGCVKIEEEEVTVYSCKDDHTLTMCINDRCIDEDCSENKNGKTICGPMIEDDGTPSFDCLAPSYEYTATCKNNVLEVCEKPDVCIEYDCTKTLEVCDAKEMDCVAPTVPYSCVNNAFQINDEHGAVASINCSANTDGKTFCDAQKGCIAVDQEQFTCENNTVYLLTGTDRIEGENCTETGQLCDPTQGICVSAGEGNVKCEGASTVVVYHGKDAYRFDCSTRADDNKGCNTYYGCTDVYCLGTEVYVCLPGESCMLYGDCADDGLVCSEKLQDCTESCDTSTPVTCNGDNEIRCVNGEIVKTNCAAKGMSCSAAQDGCYNNISICGNGVVDSGEACDPGGIGGAAPSEIKGRSCSDWNGVDYEYLGEISCGAAGSKNACKLVSDKCYKSTDVETREESWTFSGNLGSYKQSGAIDLNGGFKESSISSAGGWTTGYWIKGTSPDFNNKYIQYNPSEMHAADLTAFASASIRFNVYRNGTAGPANIMIAMYSGNQLVAKSRAISVTTTSTAVIVPVFNTAQYTDTFTFRISGYNAGSDNGGTLTIDNMTIWTSTK